MKEVAAKALIGSIQHAFLRAYCVPGPRNIQAKWKVHEVGMRRVSERKGTGSGGIGGRPGRSSRQAGSRNLQAAWHQVVWMQQDTEEQCEASWGRCTKGSESLQARAVTVGGVGLLDMGVRVDAPVWGRLWTGLPQGRQWAGLDWGWVGAAETRWLVILIMGL